MSVEKLNELKVRIFDLSESLQERNQFEADFFNALADLLDIEESQRNNVQLYIDKVIELKEKLPVETENVESKDAE